MGSRRMAFSADVVRLLVCWSDSFEVRYDAKYDIPHGNPEPVAGSCSGKGHWTKMSIVGTPFGPQQLILVCPTKKVGTSESNEL